MIVTQILFIWLASSILGFITFPLLYRCCPRLPDRGYSVARIAGIVIVTYLAWISASLKLLPFSTFSVCLGAVLLAAASLAAVWNKREEFFLFLRKKIRFLLFSELFFLAAFILFLSIIALKPDIDPDSERFMDYALLNGIVHTKFFPPLDPWFAGKTMNYYYYGYILLAGLHKLAAVPLGIFFNIALALIYALFVQACFGIGYNLSRKISYGLLAVLLIMFIGNLSGVSQIFGKGFAGFSTFEGARVMVQKAPDGTILDYPINEFPIFSLFYGDLHPYVITYAVNMAIINLLYSLYLFPVRRNWFEPGEDRFPSIGNLILLAVVIGCLVGAHTWDYPVYLAVAVAGLAYKYLFLRRREPDQEADKKQYLGFFLPALSLIVLSFILYLPFNLHFLGEQAGQNRGGIGIVELRTPLGLFLVAVGLYIFFPAVYCITRLINSEPGKGDSEKSSVAPFIFFILAAIPAIIMGGSAGAAIPSYFFMLLLLAGGISVLFFFPPGNEGTFALILTLVALGLTFFCEFFFMIDHYQGGGYERMNTMFKVYTNVWLLLGAAGVFFIFLLNRHWRDKKSARIFWRLSVSAVLAAGFFFTLGAYYTHSQTARRPPTLDGLAYIESPPPPNHKKEWRWDRYDLEAARWLRENTEGRPVILETTGNAYDWASRISTLSGLPTLVGWVNHEAGWRNDWKEPGQRQRDTDTIYKTANLNTALHLIGKYNIRYIYVGRLEKEKYPAESLAKFSRIGRKVYQNGPTLIWEIGG